LEFFQLEAFLTDLSEIMNEDMLQASFAYNKYCCAEAKPVETRPILESSQTRFKIIPTNQNAPFDRLILTSVTKIVTQRRNKP